MKRIHMQTIGACLVCLLLAGCPGTNAREEPAQAAASGDSAPPASNDDEAAKAPADETPPQAKATAKTTNEPQRSNEEPKPEGDDMSESEAAAAGLESLQEGEFETAIKRFTVALAESPSPTLFYYRGVAHELAGHADKAIADLSKCIEAEPDETRALYSRHLTYRKLEKWDDAFADVRRAYAIDSGDFRIANAYAQMLTDSPVKAHHDAQLAVKVATAACKLTDWQDALCVETLADAYRAAGDDAKAEEYVKKAKDLSSGSFDYDYVRKEIQEYFEYHFDKAPEELALQEIVPGKVSVSVWTIDRKDEDKPNVIFTTGMSELPMAVPADSDDGPFAEVCMHLPADWPTQPDLKDMSKSWPWIWLRMVAHYPHEKKTWIGHYPSVFPVDGPLKPPGGDSKFTALLLVPNLGALKGFHSDEGPQIAIITAIPIYTEEYDLAKQDDGIRRLFNRFDEEGISGTFDVKRLNVALPK